MLRLARFRALTMEEVEADEHGRVERTARHVTTVQLDGLCARRSRAMWAHRSSPSRGSPTSSGRARRRALSCSPTAPSSSRASSPSRGSPTSSGRTRRRALVNYAQLLTHGTEFISSEQSGFFCFCLLPLIEACSLIEKVEARHRVTRRLQFCGTRKSSAANNKP